MPVRDPLARTELVELLQGLVRLPSVNPTLAPEEGCTEAAVARFAVDWLAERGVDAWTEEVVPDRPNAVARTGSGRGATLVLCAHLDTVGTAGMSIAPFEPTVAGNRLYGRGSYDMKCGAAACMAAAAALAPEELPGTLLLALVCDEEYASIGASEFVRRHRADACILTEPSPDPLALVLAHKGFVWLKVTTHGTAAHGSRWDLGVSAIGRMGRIIAELERFDRTVLRTRTHALLPAPSLHCALIAGGSGLSTYAEECVLQVERRTLPGETAGQVLAEVQDAVAAAGESADVELLLERAPLECDADSEIARTVRASATSVLGHAPAQVGVSFWMDAAIFAGAGIPTVNFGPDGAGAHAAVEWADIDSVVACARVLTESARRFCGARA